MCVSMLDANTDRTLFTIGAIIIAGILFGIFSTLMNGDEGVWTQTKSTVNQLFEDTNEEVDAIEGRSLVVDPEHDW